MVPFFAVFDGAKVHLIFDAPKFQRQNLPFGVN